MTLDKYLQTIKNCILIDGFGNIKFSRFICLVAFLFFYQYCFADDIRKEIVGDRIVTERHALESNFYYYTIDVYDNKALEIKLKKTPYMAITTYPAWTNYPLYVQETNDFVKYCRSMFGKNQKELTVEDMRIRITYILVDDGTIICTRIKADVSLFDLYTPNEISDIFHKISTYRYSTPLVLNPKEGYYENSFRIWK